MQMRRSQCDLGPLPFSKVLNKFEKGLPMGAEMNNSSLEVRKRNCEISCLLGNTLLQLAAENQPELAATYTCLRKPRQQKLH